MLYRSICLNMFSNSMNIHQIEMRLIKCLEMRKNCFLDNMLPNLIATHGIFNEKKILIHERGRRKLFTLPIVKIPGFSVFLDRIFANNTDSNRREMDIFKIFYDKTQSLEGVAVSCRHR